MKTQNTTTYILLDRGTEDAQLLKELYKITALTGISSIEEFTTKFPKIQELKEKLWEHKPEI